MCVALCYFTVVLFKIVPMREGGRCAENQVLHLLPPAYLSSNGQDMAGGFYVSENAGFFI